MFILKRFIIKLSLFTYNCMFRSTVGSAGAVAKAPFRLRSKQYLERNESEKVKSYGTHVTDNNSYNNVKSQLASESQSAVTDLEQNPRVENTTCIVAAK